MRSRGEWIVESLGRVIRVAGLAAVAFGVPGEGSGRGLDGILALRESPRNCGVYAVFREDWS